MTPESQNSPLLDNDFPTHVSLGMRTRGDRLHVNGINTCSTDTRKQQIFPTDTRYTMKAGAQRRFSRNSLAREVAIQA
jgi:hypothetical protein